MLNNSIIGDSGSKRAQLGPLGASAFAEARQSAGSEFSVFEQLKIDENFWDSTFTEHYIQGTNSSLNSGGIDAYIQFNTVGWVRADEISLTVPIYLNYNWRRIANQTKSAFPKEPNINPRDDDISDNWSTPQITDAAASPCFVFTKERLLNAYHGQYSMLDIFRRITITVGNNAAPVQKTIETMPQGMKHLMVTHKRGPLVSKMMSFWGLPIHTLAPTSLVTDELFTDNETRIWTSNYHLAEPTTTRLHDYQKDPMIQGYCEFLHNSAVGPDSDSTARIFGGVQTLESIAQQAQIPRNFIELRVKRELCLPLQCICSFFRGARWLPPDFRINLQFEKATGLVPLCYSSPVGEFAGIVWPYQPKREAATQEYYLPFWPTGAQMVSDADVKNTFIMDLPVVIMKAYGLNGDLNRDWTSVNTTIDPPDGLVRFGTEFIPELDIFPRGPLRDFSVAAELEMDNLRVIYTSHTLVASLQGKMMAMWLSQPFLYNYESTETYEIVAIDGQNSIHMDVVISAQRPTVLYFQLVSNFTTRWGDSWDSELRGHRVYKALQVTRVREGSDWQPEEFPIGLFDLYGGIGSFCKHQTRWNDAVDIRQTIRGQYCNSYLGEERDLQRRNITWSNFEIRFSGRTAYRFRNDKSSSTPDQGRFSYSAYDFITGMQFEGSYKSYGSESVILGDDDLGHLFGTNRHLNAAMNPYLLKCVIQPGNLAERGLITNKQGAATIQINIDFETYLSQGHSLIMYRTNPEQLSYDSDKNATLIQWPAIATRNGYLIPNITQAP